MFGFSPKLPISEDERQWVNEGFRRLEKLLGRRRMLEARVITPTAEDFPDAYDTTPEAALRLFSRVCDYMHVDPCEIEFEIFPDETEQIKSVLSCGGTAQKGAAGFYLPAMEEGTSDGSAAVVAIRSSQLKDPTSLVATIAHELGHVILVGGKLISPKADDQEPLTDLLTVFLGLGIFSANASLRFRQFKDVRHVGWSMQRLGYLREEAFSYALAKFVVERGEDRIAWEKHLSTNARAYFRRSRAWLVKNPDYVAIARPIG